MARRPPHRYGSRSPVADLSPRVLAAGVTGFVLATYAALQLFITRSSVTFLWWRAEQVRVEQHFLFPKAVTGGPAGAPTWQEWVPTAVTAVGITAALMALAIVLVRSGRGMWLLLVAALPLVPAELVPGVWAPPLANASAYALVFPPGAIQPDTLWAWVEALLQSFAVILPAFVVGRMMHVRPARDWAGSVLARFVVPAVALASYLAWNVAVGMPVDWGQHAHAALLVLIGGLAISGTRAPRWTLVGLVVLPALAGGLVTWSTDVSGLAAVVIDRAAWWDSALVLLGVAWVVAYATVRSGTRRVWRVWRAALDHQVAESTPAAVDEDEPIAVVDEPAAPVDDDEPVAPVVSRRRLRAAAEPAGGRHRA